MVEAVTCGRDEVETTGGIGGTANFEDVTMEVVVEAADAAIDPGVGYLAFSLEYEGFCKLWKVMAPRGLNPPGIPQLA